MVNANEMLEAVNNPEDPDAGSREIPFSRVIYIEKNDFMEDPPRKFFRLGLGREVRLRYAYFITCTNVVKDENGNIKEVHCTYDHETKGGNAPDGRKVKGTIHWVTAKEAIDAEVRIYDRLFSKIAPERDGDFLEALNPDSCLVKNAKLEPCLIDPGSQTYQFERLGYFKKDEKLSKDENIFIRVVSLRDSWARWIKQNGA